MNPVIVLPWSVVMHDNHRLMPVRTKKAARLITAPDYRKAKVQAEWEIKRQWKGLPIEGDVVLHAKAFFPNRRRRDCANYRKLVTDAMSEICYADDSQLVCETWELAGFDNKSPRIEIELRSASPRSLSKGEER